MTCSATAYVTDYVKNCFTFAGGGCISNIPNGVSAPAIM